MKWLRWSSVCSYVSERAFSRTALTSIQPDLLVIKPNHEEVRWKKANPENNDEREYSYCHFPSGFHLRKEQEERKFFLAHFSILFLTKKWFKKKTFHLILLVVFCLSLCRFRWKCLRKGNSWIIRIKFIEAEKYLRFDVKWKPWRWYDLWPCLTYSLGNLIWLKLLETVPEKLRQTSSATSSNKASSQPNKYSNF